MGGKAWECGQLAQDRIDETAPGTAKSGAPFSPTSAHRSILVLQCTKDAIVTDRCLRGPMAATNGRGSDALRCKEIWSKAIDHFANCSAARCHNTRPSMMLSLSCQASSAWPVARHVPALAVPVSTHLAITSAPRPSIHLMCHGNAAANASSFSCFRQSIHLCISRLTERSRCGLLEISRGLRFGR